MGIQLTVGVYMLLEDLLQVPDPRNAVNHLVRLFREQWALPEVHQLGLVVPDVEKAADVLEREGIGPFFVASGTPLLWRERGQERRVHGKMALTRYKGLELELLEPLKGSDFYSHSLDPEGRIVLQHLGFLVADVDAWANRVAQAGYPVWVRGQLGLGPIRTDFAYMDTLESAGIILEFICWQMAGVRFSPPGSILKAVGWLEKKSGKRCLSI